MSKEIYLTFDMDWAIDEVLEEFYSLINGYLLSATIHVTHNTRLLDIFRKDQNVELGIHPNFNFLLSDVHGDNGINYREVISKIKSIVPEGVSVRSHSLTDSSLISSLYDEYGIKYDLNKYIPPMAGCRILPYKSAFSKAIVIPFLFEDDIYLEMNEKCVTDYYLSDEFDYPRVFNFHPIHLFLNTSSMEHYREAKQYYKEYSCLKDYVNNSTRGIRNMFCELVNTAKQRGYVFRKISEGKWT